MVGSVPSRYRTVACNFQLQLKEIFILGIQIRKEDQIRKLKISSSEQMKTY